MLIKTNNEATRLKAIWVAKSGSLNLTYQKAATHMGFKPGAISSVSHMLNGINDINLKRGLEFCELLEIHLSDFSPRLQKEAEKIASQVRGRSGESPDAANVYWLVGKDEMAVKDIILNSSGAAEKVFWIGPHSKQTYAIEVLSEANSPALPSGAVAFVDLEVLPKPGKMFCLLRNGSLAFAKYLGDNVATLVNDSFPDPVFQLTDDEEIIGCVIGHQIQG
tara:strand:- start:771 stop:1433 length:663 start_codon:yes stop_codon:yes gene_type:complete